MRRPLVAGNWKMNLNRAGAIDLTKNTAAGLRDAGLGERVDVALCPPFVYLEAVRGALGESGLQLGAQDLYYEKSGAFTGEVAAEMLADVGVRYVIIGHSERRHTIGHLEDDRMVNLKLRAARRAGLTPILCVGEMLDERKAGLTNDVLTFQLRAALIEASVQKEADLVVAYEPVWAIGTGQNATPAQAQEAHAHLRRVLRDVVGEVADRVRILYGGSLKPENAAEITGQVDVDGGLIGGASLKAESFVPIVRAALGSAGR